jgi:hypothetical protein
MKIAMSSVLNRMGKIAKAIDDEALSFMKKHPNPKDSIVENYAKKHGYKPSAFEEAIYRITTKGLRGRA